MSMEMLTLSDLLSSHHPEFLQYIDFPLPGEHLSHLDILGIKMVCQLFSVKYDLRGNSCAIFMSVSI